MAKFLSRQGPGPSYLLSSAFLHTEDELGAGNCLLGIRLPWEGRTWLALAFSVAW